MQVGSRALLWDFNLEATAHEWADELAGRERAWGSSFKTHCNDQDPDDCSDADTCWYARHAIAGNFDLQS
eukprot:2176811-Rhodomonas_salina.1